MMKEIKIRDFVIIVVGIIIDILSKSYIVSNYALYESKELIPGFLSITYIQNTGAAWNLLEGRLILFYVLTVVAIVFMAYMYYTTHIRLQKIAFALMISGTLGNFIDRVRLGYVIDFINTIIFTYDFPVFNVADSCLVIGAIVLIISLIKYKE